MEFRAFTRHGVDLRQSGVVEHKLRVKNTAAEYAQLVSLGAMQAVCTAVRYVPTSARLAAGQRAAHQAVTGIAGRRQGTVRPNTSLKRSANGRPRYSRLLFLLPRGLPSAPA
jgi:hypothetical protein